MAIETCCSLPWLFCAMIVVAIFPSAKLGFAQTASKPPTKETVNQVQSLLQKRGQLPPATTIRVDVLGKDYESDTKSTLIADTHGRFRRVGEDGVSTTGFDGTGCWARESSGFSRRLDYSDRDIPIFLAWFRTGQWLDHIDPSILNFEKTESDEEHIVFSVAHSRASSKVCFSSRSGLAEWFQFHGVQGEVTCRFSSYETQFGIPLPHVFRSDSALGSHESKVTSVMSLSEEIDYSKPKLEPPRIRFDSAISESLVVSRTPTGHLLVDVALDDGVLRKFIFDTGAGATVIDSTLADDLGIEDLGQQSLASIFGAVNTTVYRGRSLRIGCATLENLRLIGMDLAAIREMLGEEKIDGIIGFDLLSQCVCEIELASDSIRLFDESRYSLLQTNETSWNELTWLQNVPLMKATFPQGEGIFRMDVGAASGPAGNVIFHTSTVESMKIDTSAMHVAKSGESEFAVGSIEWFELAGHRFENPVVLYSLSKFGPLAERNIDGNLGVEFLKVFRLVLDYRNARMALSAIK